MGAILLESSIIFVRNYEVCYKYIPTFILEMLLHVLHSLVIILLYMEMVKYIIFLKQNPSKPGRENFNPRDGFVRSSSVLFCTQYHHRPRSANTPLRSSQTFCQKNVGSSLHI